MSAKFAVPFQSFVSPARPRAQLWRFGLGICVAGLVYALWSVLLVAGFWWWTGTDQPLTSLRAIPDAKTPLHTYVLLATFIGMGLGPMVAVRLLHRRSIGTLFGRAATVLRDFTAAAGLVGMVYGLTLVIWFWQYDGVPKLDPILWLTLLPLSLLAIAIQTGAEELVFRGYLQQQLAARFRSPVIWLLLPSLTFGLLHYDPVTSGPNLWFVVAATTLFGLAAADLTARTGSIGAGWGFHFANNTAALLVVSVEDTIPGLALFTTPYGANDPVLSGLVIADIVTLALAWLLVRRVLQR